MMRAIISVRGSERGQSVIVIALAAMLIGAVAAKFLYNTAVHDVEVVYLDGVCQQIASASLKAFPHSRGGFPNLNPRVWDAGFFTPSFDGFARVERGGCQSSDGPLCEMFLDIHENVEGVMRLAGVESDVLSAVPWISIHEAADEANYNDPIAGDVPSINELRDTNPEKYIYYSVSPNNHRQISNSLEDEIGMPLSGRFNDGVTVMVAVVRNPWGLDLSFGPTDELFKRIVRVECEATQRPQDVLVMYDTSEAVGQWTTAGDGGTYQKLCTADGKFYENLLHISRDVAGANIADYAGKGVGGPIRKFASNIVAGTEENITHEVHDDITELSLCFRVCTGEPVEVEANAAEESFRNEYTAEPWFEADNTLNPYMLLAGPAGMQKVVNGKPVVEPIDCTKVDASKQANCNAFVAANPHLVHPYPGQLIVCNSAHYKPEDSHIMLTRAAEGRSLFCAKDPEQTDFSGDNRHGYHPICINSSSETSLGTCITDDADVACQMVPAPSFAGAAVPAPADAVFTERSVINYMTASSDIKVFKPGPIDDPIIIKPIKDLADTKLSAKTSSTSSSSSSSSNTTSSSSSSSSGGTWETQDFLTAIGEPEVASFTPLGSGPNNARRALVAGGSSQELYNGAITEENNADDVWHSLTAETISANKELILLHHQKAWNNYLLALHHLTSPIQCANPYVLGLKLAQYDAVNSFEGAHPMCDVDSNGEVTEAGKCYEDENGVAQNWSNSVTRLAVGHFSDTVVFSNGGLDEDGNAVGDMFASTPAEAYRWPLASGAMTEENLLKGEKYGCEAWFRKAPLVASGSSMWSYPEDPKFELEKLPPLESGFSIPFIPNGLSDAAQSYRKHVGEAPTPLAPLQSVTQRGVGLVGVLADANLDVETSLFGEVPDGNGTWESLGWDWTGETGYSSPVPGFFRVGPPSDQGDDGTVLYNPDAAGDNEKDKNKVHFAFGWSPGGETHTFTALEVAAIALAQAERRAGSASMIKTSAPEKTVVMYSNPPQDMQCLLRKAFPTSGSTAAPANDAAVQTWFQGLDAGTKAGYCRECWDDVLTTFDQAWAGDDIAGSATDTDYSRRIALKLHVFDDNGSDSKYCGRFSIVDPSSWTTPTDWDTVKTDHPWLEVNIFKTLNDTIIAQSGVFLKESLRAR